MRVLVYGAGVLGSYLAHVLHCGGNDVTLLARGKRLEELSENGLVIRHYMQLRTTVDRIKLTDNLGKSDSYDIVFVVMQRTQLDDVLPQICANEGSGVFVLVGNNTTAKETLQYIQEHSKVPKKVVFGFQSTGGRRENGRVISIYLGFSKLSGSMTVGELSGDDSWQSPLEQAFEKTSYQIKYNKNMDAWLKCHVAFIMPVAFACYYTDGNLKKIAGNKHFLNRMVEAIDEAYQIVEACGYPIEPEEDKDFMVKHRYECYLMLKLMAATPIGRLACSDHAMTAKGEMKRLYEDFCNLKKSAHINTPAWDELEHYII
jgi:2-dehydropantoate 2-reductase